MNPQSSIFNFLYTMRCKSCVFGLIFGITVTSMIALCIVLIITPYMRKAEKHAYGQQSILCSSNVRWEPCSVTCGRGIQVGMLSVQCLYETDFIGDWNVTLHQPCVYKSCPVTGYWSNWTEVGFCSVSCGEGVLTIVREFWNSKVQNERQACDRKQWGLGFCIQPDCKPISEINIALGKDTHQSSTKKPTKLFYSKLAVDGKIKTKYITSGPKCIHTNEGRQEWWAVDLGDIYQITNVVIYGRTDCCGDRLSNFDIEAIMPVLFQDSNWATFQEGQTTLCYHRQDVLPTHVLQAYCSNPGAIGKYLRVRLLGKKTPLTLCEVQVYGRFVREFKTVQTVINFGMEIIKPKPYDGQWLEAANRNDSQSCTDLCKTKSKCEVYNFNETTQECVMSIKGALSHTGP